MQPFKWKLEFEETCVLHHELNSLLIFKGFSNEINSDIKNVICEYDI